jgi:uncharacterized oxidoreductase
VGPREHAPDAPTVDGMDITNRTVFIPGATSGIGLELARRLRDAGSTVVVGGRRTELLAELTAEGLGTVSVDVTSDASVTAARDTVLREHPDLDTVVTMSGVLLVEDLRDPSHFETARTTIDVNVLGTIRVVDAFTPHLIARAAAGAAPAFLTVSSGIGFLPFPVMPTYGASKAAVHAYTDSLRVQLAADGIAVHEIVPPAVATTPEAKEVNPAALDLDAYVAEVLDILRQDPTPDEILVEGVRMHRWAERDGTYADLVARRSAALAMLPGRA